MMNQEDIEYYGKYASVLEQSKAYMLEEIGRLLENVTSDPEHAPAEHILGRIKSAQSMREKLRRRGFDQDDARTGIQNLSDAIGVRIVTHFVGDVYLILDELKRSDKWEVVTVKDYIVDSKPNGYRSLHVILKVPVECDDFDSIEAEIQLRTIAMDCWASLEHQLKYKKNIEDPELIIAELKRCADEMASTDLTMQTLREMIRSQ